MIPDFDGKGVVVALYSGFTDGILLLHVDKNHKLVFSTPMRSKNVRYYNQAESEEVKIDMNCHIEGDICGKMMYFAMFNTTFIESNMLLILNRDEIDLKLGF